MNTPSAVRYEARSAAGGVVFAEKMEWNVEFPVTEYVDDSYKTLQLCFYLCIEIKAVRDYQGSQAITKSTGFLAYKLVIPTILMLARVSNHLGITAKIEETMPLVDSDRREARSRSPG